MLVSTTYLKLEYLYKKMKEIVVCNHFRLLISPGSCFPVCGVSFLFISKHILFNIWVVMARVLNNPKNVCDTLLMPPLLLSNSCMWAE